MVNELLLSENREKIEEQVIKILNADLSMSKKAVNDPRSVGAEVQGFLEENIS